MLVIIIKSTVLLGMPQKKPGLAKHGLVTTGVNN